jgi:hypothetical protein
MVMVVVNWTLRVSPGWMAYSVSDGGGAGVGLRPSELAHPVRKIPIASVKPTAVVA